jgi:hypothetical protein
MLGLNSEQKSFLGQWKDWQNSISQERNGERMS